MTIDDWLGPAVLILAVIGGAWVFGWVMRR